MNQNLQDKKTFQQNNKSKNYTQLSQVKSHYSDLWKSEQHDVDTINKLAETYYNQGNFTGAIALCHKALKEQANFAPVYKTLGNILQAQNKEEGIRRKEEGGINKGEKLLEICIF